MDASLLFWGKTYDVRERHLGERIESFKPVVHHMLDVAAVASSFLRCQEARLLREAALIAMAPEDYANLIGFLAGLHDLGKFTRNFQAKVEALWPASLGAWPGADLIRTKGLGHRHILRDPKTISAVVHFVAEPFSSTRGE